jgi:hypothetical protein
MNYSYNELREENLRLLSQLSLTKNRLKLLEKYRNCLKLFLIYCECDQNFSNKSNYFQLENHYKKTLISEEIEKLLLIIIKILLI